MYNSRKFYKGYKVVLPFLNYLFSPEENKKRRMQKMRMIFIGFLLLIGIFFISACNESSKKLSKIEISRYRVELKKTGMDCLFNYLLKYLSSDEEQESYYTQKGQAKYLDEIENLSNVYLLSANKKEFYIDFILLSNKHNLRTFYLKIAGESEFVDPFVKELSNHCKIESIESIEKADKDLIKWSE